MGRDECPACLVLPPDRNCLAFDRLAPTADAHVCRTPRPGSTKTWPCPECGRVYLWGPLGGVGPYRWVEADAAAGADLRERLADIIDITDKGESKTSVWEIADALLPLVREEAAKAWDEGREAGYDDACFDYRGSSRDPDAHEFPRRNPYRAASPQPARDQGD
jgi:hypothetical protein